MKSLLVHILLMTITFLLGIGFDWLMPKHSDSTFNCGLPEMVKATPVVTSPSLIFDYDPSKFAPDGTYVMNWPALAEFSEFRAFDVWRIQPEDPSSSYVGIQTYFNNTYSGQPAFFAYVNERRLFLVTESNPEGLSYRVEGEFTQDPGANADTKIPVLYAKLTKSKNGEKIAEGHFYFRLKRIRD